MIAFLCLPFYCKIDLWKIKTKIKNNVQGFGGMIKHFAKVSSSDNVQDTEVIWSQKIFQSQ